MYEIDSLLDASRTHKSTPSHETLQTAAEWFALLRLGNATEQECAEWNVWLDQCSEHREAWHYVEIISQRFDSVQSGPDRQAAASAFQKVRAKRVTRRQALGSLAGLAGGGLLAWLGWRHTPLPGRAMAWSADYRTATGEIRDFTLADSTHIGLNTASAVNASIQADVRRLHLIAGEVLIRTASDPHRAFVVDTHEGSMQALGTRFTVRQEENATFLAVYEGAVKIRLADTGEGRVVEVGHQVTFTRDTISAPVPADRSREVWANGILLAEDISLAELVRELARYRSGHLGVAPEVAELRVLGGYPLHDPDKVLAMLEAVLPITVRRTLPWWVTIEAETPGS